MEMETKGDLRCRFTSLHGRLVPSPESRFPIPHFRL